MLVLSRRKGQSIKIGDTVVVHVVSVKRGTVRIAIDAPKNQKISRAVSADPDESAIASDWQAVGDDLWGGVTQELSNATADQLEALLGKLLTKR